MTVLLLVLDTFRYRPTSGYVVDDEDYYFSSGIYMYSLLSLIIMMMKTIILVQVYMYSLLSLIIIDHA